MRFMGAPSRASVGDACGADSPKPLSKS